MKKYITVMVFDTHAETPEEAVRQSTVICKQIQHNHGGNPQIETIQEVRLNGWANKNIDFHRIQRKQSETKET